MLCTTKNNCSCIGLYTIELWLPRNKYWCMSNPPHSIISTTYVPINCNSSNFVPSSCRCTGACSIVFLARVVKTTSTFQQQSTDSFWLMYYSFSSYLRPLDFLVGQFQSTCKNAQQTCTFTTVCNTDIGPRTNINQGSPKLKDIKVINFMWLLMMVWIDDRRLESTSSFTKALFLPFLFYC